MSNSEAVPRRPATEENAIGHLVAEGAPGVKIEIIDALFRTVAEGARRVEAKLPEGLYTVRWLGAGEVEEQPVRLFAGTTLEARSAAMCGADLASLVCAVPAAAAAGRSREAEIAIFVEADSAVQSDPARSVRLTSVRRKELKPDDKAVLGAGRRAYRVEPGTYRLRYEDCGRRRVEQTLYAFPGRRTLVFMRYGRGYEMRLRDGETSRTALRGIDPAANLVVSVGLGGSDVERRECYALHQTLLSGLAGGEALIDPELADEIAGPEADPYLKLYAATFLLQRRARPWDPERGGEPWFPELAERMVASMPEGEWADRLCLQWKLAAIGMSDLGSAGRSRLNIPPMLSQCWQWAVERTAEHPGALRQGGSFEAAADASSAHLPWLAWHLADVRRRAPQAQVSLESLGSKLGEILERAGRLGDGPLARPLDVSGGASLRRAMHKMFDKTRAAVRGRSGRPATRPEPEAALTMSDAAARLIDDVMRVQARAQIHGDRLDQRRMIKQLGMPADRLLRHADEALNELRAIAPPAEN